MMKKQANEDAHTWTTAKQCTFLAEHFPAYFKIHSKPNPKYIAFWAQLREAWFKVYPEIKLLFPDIASEQDLTPDQIQQLKKAMKARTKVNPIIVCITALLILLI